MSQNRDAPAYQEYAASMMAKIAYRTMTLQERGLFYSMRQECWVNERLPESPDLLSKVLGFAEQQISDSLPAVMPFFAVADGLIFCPELEDYRKHLLEQKEKKVNGGRLGATITNKKKKSAKNRMDKEDSTIPTPIPSGMSTADPQLPRRLKVGSLVQYSQVQPSPNQSLVKELKLDPFVKEMNEYESKLNIVRKTV